MYNILDLVVMGLIVLSTVVGAIVILATMEKPRSYVALGEGIRQAVMQLMIIGFLLWFGFLGRDIGHGLMTVTTWVLVGWKICVFLNYLSKIENSSCATIRSTDQVIWGTISVMVQTAGVSLMFGLALAYGG